MKKLVIDKSEGIAEIIDRILAVQDSEVVLVIPKGSVLGKSASNFRLLKREAEDAEKTVVIESVDDMVLALAKAHGIESSHSLLRSVSSHEGVSDIVSRREKEDDYDNEAEERRSRKGTPVKLTVRAEEDEEEDDQDDRVVAEPVLEKAEEEKAEKSFFGSDRFFTKQTRPARFDDDDDDEGGMSGRKVGWIIAIVVVLAVAFYVVTWTFGRAQVTINFTQTPWTYQGNFTADKSISAIDPSTNEIPAQVFTTDKNITQLFPATGKAASVSVKAQGTITIYNDYSSDPQQLVATTRFETPNGQIFRLVNGVTVPGEQTANGQLVPSSITAPIVADQPGPTYNVGPVTKLTIPGFQSDSAREAGFYGAILGQTTGGFIGNAVVPTAGDIANAKASTTAILQSDLQEGLTSSYPNNFKILDGATDIQVGKLIVNTSTDQNGNFSVFGEATLTAIGFDEAGFKTYLLSLAQSQEASSTFVSINLNYSNVQATFSKGQVSFALSAQGTLEPVFSPDDFASSIAGTSIGNARDAIQALPNLASGKISVWPMWLWDIPANTNKIQVTSS